MSLEKTSQPSNSELSPLQFELLASLSARECYKLGIKPSDLAPYTENRKHFDLLVSDDEYDSALACYRLGIKPADLAPYIDNPEQFMKLTSLSARECYKFGIKPSDLAPYTENVVHCKVLISDVAIECYKLGLKPADFAPHTETKCDTSFFASYRQGQCWVLFSFSARECYKLGLKPADLAPYTNNLEQLKALTSFDAIVCYKLGLITFFDLAKKNPDEINAITSYYVEQCGILSPSEVPPYPGFPEQPKALAGETLELEDAPSA